MYLCLMEFVAWLPLFHSPMTHLMNCFSLHQEEGACTATIQRDKIQFKSKTHLSVKWHHDFWLHFHILLQWVASILPHFKGKFSWRSIQSTENRMNEEEPYHWAIIEHATPSQSIHKWLIQQKRSKLRKAVLLFTAIYLSPVSWKTSKTKNAIKL